MRCWLELLVTILKHILMKSVIIFTKLSEFCFVPLRKLYFYFALVLNLGGCVKFVDTVRLHTLIKFFQFFFLNLIKNE